MIAFVVVPLVLAVVVMLGMGRWILDRAALHGRLERSRIRTPAAPYDPAEIRGLPTPVVRYFEVALTPGCAFIETATLVQEGTLRTSSTMRFTATQRVTVRRPGFIWEASVPGPLGLRAIDAYAGGQGSFHLVLLRGVLHLAGWLPVRDTRVQAEMATIELQRWLAETPWYPTALLPQAGITWEAVDDRSARATMTDGLTVATLLFRFGDDGLVSQVFAEARGRLVGGRIVSEPWAGEFSTPKTIGGYVVPTEGRVRWGEGESYWIGRLVNARYAS